MGRIFQSILYVIASATHKELARQVRYLKVENQILREKLPERITVTQRERQRLLKYGEKLGKAIHQLVTIEGEDIPLWAGEAPTAADLLAHLQENLFFQHTASQFKPSWIPVPVSNELAMVTRMIGRGEPVADELLRFYAQRKSER